MDGKLNFWLNYIWLLVKFKPIATNEWNSVSSTGKDIGYLISINNSLTADIKIEDPLATEFIFNGLSPPNTQFLIRMRTFNSIGMSEMSIETMEKTFESGE
jgi:hypothetical protein